MSITRKSLGRAAIAAAFLAGIPLAASAQIAVRQDVKTYEVPTENQRPAETAAEKQGNSPHFAVKTNVLSDATLSPSLAFELGLGPKSSLDLYGAYNNWTFSDNKKWKHWIAQPGIRWWTCERFDGSFFGVHLHGGEFNVGGVGPFKTLKENRYEGWFVGGGVSYGYQWTLSNRFSLEAEIGAGYARMWYDKFGCAECAPKIGEGTYNYFGPTKAILNLVFFLR